MFLKETTVRSGGRRYTYVQLVEGYRDERGRVRQRVVANLGRKEKLKASGELDRLAAAFTRLDPPPAGTRRRCGALALVARYLERLGLAEAIEHACPVHGRAQLTHGEVIGALVANRLCDPRPLYDVRGWADEQGAHPLLGTPAALLNDDRLGRALDALAAHVEQVKGALCLRALERFGCEPARVHWDFTSVSVFGSHDGSELIRFGHSSDKRAHLRQTKLGQAVSEEGVALYHRSEAGARNETGVVCDALEALKAALGRQDFLLCADTALVSEGNLRALIADGISFLAPLPHSFGYRGAELDWPLELESGERVALRALLVHSSEEQAACRRSRARQLERAEDKLERVKRGLGGRHYPDRDAVERKLAQLLQGTPGRFLRAETDERDGKPTLSFSRDGEAIAEAERLDGIYC